MPVGGSPVEVFGRTVEGYTGAVHDLVIAMGQLGELVKVAHADVSERLDRIEQALGIEGSSLEDDEQ